MGSAYLRIMNNIEFLKFKELTVFQYANDCKLAGRWQASEANSKALQEFEAYAPNGQVTPNNHFWSILRNEDDMPIGSLWVVERYAATDSEMRLISIWIQPEYRSLGFGRAAMDCLEKMCRQQSVHRLTLHVFNHNTVGQKFYKTLGFNSSGDELIKRFQTSQSEYH